MAKKKFIFNDFYYSTEKVDFEKGGTRAKSDMLALMSKRTMSDNVFCEVKYNVVGDEEMMITIDSRFYVKPSESDNYSIYNGKSVFFLPNEYPMTIISGDDHSFSGVSGDYHSNNGTVWNLGATLSELVLQHLSKHIGYIYCETKNTILIEIPATFGLCQNLFKKGLKNDEWILLEDNFFYSVQLVEQTNEDDYLE